MWHYYLKAYWDNENITGPTILKPTFVTALFSLSCGCGVDGIFCTPLGGAWSPPPQIREILPAVVTLHVLHCVLVCETCWASVMCCRRVQLAMKSSVGRCIQNVWSSMVERSWGRWGSSGHMFLSMAKISKHTWTLQSSGPLQPQSYVLNKPQEEEKITATRALSKLLVQ